LPSPEERHVLARFLAGDPAAVARVSDWARGVIAGRGYYVPDSEQEDLLQETIIQIYRAASAPDFALQQTAVAFVRSVAHRRCVDWLRCRRIERPFNPESVSPGAGPDEALLKDEKTTRALRVLALLGESCRRLIHLRVGDGLPYRVIARRLGRSEGAVRNHMYKCLRKARGLMEDLEKRRASTPRGSES